MRGSGWFGARVNFWVIVQVWNEKAAQILEDALDRDVDVWEQLDMFAEGLESLFCLLAAGGN